MAVSLLLDTHVWLWMHQNPDKFTPAVRERLENPEQALFLSVASLWEIAIKYALGKLPLPETPESYCQQRLNDPDAAVVVLPIERAHVLRAGALSFHHRDPFDRLLIAQAQLEHFTLLTVDDQFEAYEVNLLWADRSIRETANPGEKP
jgi:PIN domain nuclease of toxin-antitoxin system